MPGHRPGSDAVARGLFREAVGLQPQQSVTAPLRSVTESHNSSSGTLVVEMQSIGRPMQSKSTPIRSNAAELMLVTIAACPW